MGSPGASPIRASRAPWASRKRTAYRTTCSTIRSSSSESDNTYDSSCSENSSDSRRLSSSAARLRSYSERTRRCRNRHSTAPAPSTTTSSALTVIGCCRSRSMAIYIQLSVLRINCNHHTALAFALSLVLAGCGAEPPPAVTRVWPVMGTMMSAAAWAADTSRLAAALSAAHDSVERIDSLVAPLRHARIAALDSTQRELALRTGVTVPADSLASGYALERAVLALAPVVDS